MTNLPREWTCLVAPSPALGGGDEEQVSYDDASLGDLAIARDRAGGTIAFRERTLQTSFGEPGAEAYIFTCR